MLITIYLLYPLQKDAIVQLHDAASEGHTGCLEHVLSTPGIDVNIKNKVSWSMQLTLRDCMSCMQP